ncbi:hypothetical protein Gotur_025961 [Gossypium turneri]
MIVKRYLNESNTKSEKSQLDLYLEGPELELNSQVDILDYWSKSSNRYQYLSLLAHDLLAILISIVAFEIDCENGENDYEDEDNGSSVAF